MAKAYNEMAKAVIMAANGEMASMKTMSAAKEKSRRIYFNVMK